MIKKGFTLAEIMIVLAVIGVLTAVLLPVAINSTPNEDIMKFKKGHNALLSAIRELVNSDKYYLDGDLGTRYDGVELRGDAPGITSYFCSTLADVIQIKEQVCTDETGTGAGAWVTLYNSSNFVPNDFRCNALISGGFSSYTITQENIDAVKEKVDANCKLIYNPVNYIVTNDNIKFYETNSGTRFASTGSKVGTSCASVSGYFPRVFSPPSQFPAFYSDQNGFDINYKVFCMDIDGIPDNATATDCVNECPFGYGIRADGKVLLGARADEWLQKSIQEKE